MPDSADFWASLYAEFGDPALAVLELGAGTFEDLRAIDRTAGVTLGGAVEVETERPEASVIARDLSERGILPSQLDGGSITLNGRSWTIESHRVESTTGGPSDGEVILILEATG